MNAAEVLDLVPAPNSTLGEIRASEIRSQLAAERRDWAAALSEIEHINANNHGESVKALRLEDPLFAAELYAHAAPNAEAVRQAPTFAPAYNDWGNLLYAKGDLPGAIAKYSDANQRSPHCADPLKAWGDVLAKQGQASHALAKYDQALKYAPHWAALIAARDTQAE